MSPSYVLYLTLLLLVLKIFTCFTFYVTNIATMLKQCVLCMFLFLHLGVH